MANRLGIGLAIMTAFIVVIVQMSAEAGGRSGRSRASARQQVATALAHAMADGRLTPQERNAILAMAQERLAPTEFEHLHRTLAGPAGLSPREPAKLAMPPLFDPPSDRATPLRRRERAPLPLVTAAAFEQLLDRPDAGAKSPEAGGSTKQWKAVVLRRDPAPLPDDTAHSSATEDEALPVGRRLPQERARASWGSAPVPETAGSNPAPGAGCLMCEPLPTDPRPPAMAK